MELQSSNVIFMIPKLGGSENRQLASDPYVLSSMQGFITGSTKDPGAYPEQQIDKWTDREVSV